MKIKEIVDDVTMKRAITRITYEIIERNKNLDKIVLAGIKTRGVYIAQRIQERLKQLENLDVPLIELDTKAYRDDVKSEQDTSLIPIEIDGTDVILVDDVLYTGRTIRAAIDGIVKLGRPARVQLAVLVDRGHRELPIRADYVGKNIPTGRDEEIIVQMSEHDGNDSILIKSVNKIDDNNYLIVSKSEETRILPVNELKLEKRTILLKINYLNQINIAKMVIILNS